MKGLRPLPVCLRVQKEPKTQGRHLHGSTESETLTVRIHRRLRCYQMKKGVMRTWSEIRQYCSSLSLPVLHPSPHVGRVKESFFLT